MTDAADDDRDVDFVLVDPDEEPGADEGSETGFVLVRDTEIVPAEQSGATRPAVDVEHETGFVVRDAETDETGFVLVRDTDLIPVEDPTRNYPATIESVETDFVLVESDGDEPTDFVLVEDDDGDPDGGLVPVDPASFALETPGVDPKRNGHH
jgi:hypothetical protein